ncbi:hypothetical protein TWF281_009068 [Arthrobotrys megalospora]
MQVLSRWFPLPLYFHLILPGCYPACPLLSILAGDAQALEHSAILPYLGARLLPQHKRLSNGAKDVMFYPRP